jgi:hypothetical protein
LGNRREILGSAMAKVLYRANPTEREFRKHLVGADPGPLRTTNQEEPEELAEQTAENFDSSGKLMADTSLPPGHHMRDQLHYR